MLWFNDLCRVLWTSLKLMGLEDKRQFWGQLNRTQGDHRHNLFLKFVFSLNTGVKEPRVNVRGWKSGVHSALGTHTSIKTILYMDLCTDGISSMFPVVAA